MTLCSLQNATAQRIPYKEEEKQNNTTSCVHPKSCPASPVLNDVLGILPKLRLRIPQHDLPRSSAPKQTAQFKTFLTKDKGKVSLQTSRVAVL